LAAALIATAAGAQPAINVGGTLFGDSTRTTAASTLDVTRAYVNITGNVDRRISFRVTPDLTPYASNTNALLASDHSPAALRSAMRSSRAAGSAEARCSSGRRSGRRSSRCTACA